MNNNYIFDDVNVQHEWQRLLAIEQMFDPATQQRLKDAGIKAGLKCLEAGAGAGSIARWMAEEVAPSGHVTAVELNPRFLKGENGFKLVQGDVLEISPDEEIYDMVHARYVLLHIPQYRKALDNLFGVLKPGGWLVLEEPDFTVAKPVNGSEEEAVSVKRVNQAIQSMYVSKGIMPDFGSRLPSIMDDYNFSENKVETDLSLTKGGAGIAEIMAQSAEQLKERYLTTGQASERDIRIYIEFCRNPKRWAVYYATVSVSAQKKK